MTALSNCIHSNFVGAFGMFDDQWGYTHEATFSPDGRTILVAMDLWVGRDDDRQVRQAYGIGATPAAAVDDCLQQIWTLRPITSLALNPKPEPVTDPDPGQPTTNLDDSPPPALSEPPAEEAAPVAEYQASEPSEPSAPQRPSVATAIAEINKLTDTTRLKQARIKVLALFPEKKQAQKVIEAIDARLNSLSASPA